MDRLRRWISAMWWRKDPADCGSAPSRVATLWDSGIYVSILLGAFSVAVAWLGAWYLSTEELKRTEAAAYQDTANLARAFEEHIIRLIQAHDQILIFARTSYRQDPQHFDLARWARDQQVATDVTLQIATIDKTGMLTASNLGMPSTPIDLSDREHFRVHADSNRDELFISKPVLGRLSGKWSIQLSRRLDAADGSFDGIVVLSIDPSYLTSFYESIDVETQGLVLLAGLDGIVRARVVNGERSTGQSLPAITPLKQLAKASYGSFLAAGQIDGITRLASYRRVRGYPLVVVVGLSRAQVLTSVEHHRVLYFAAASFVSILALSFKVMIVRRQLRLQRARDKLWELANVDSLTNLPNRNRLHDVVNAMISGQHEHTEKFALLLLDLDNFKFVNDTLGHEAGDFVLRTAAKRIKRMARQAHLVARLGGDEFAILLHNTDRKEIELIAHRVLRALRRRMKY